MSNYSAPFAQDFAARCQDLLRNLYRPAVDRDREVTLLLAIAAAGLVVPYERLSGAVDQPVMDRQAHQAETRALKKLLGETLGASRLIGPTLRDWAGGRLASAEGDPDEWPELRNKTPLSESEEVTHVVACLRNALAHGNIVCRGAPRIDSMVFVCGYRSVHPKAKTHPLRYVAVPPDGFKRFLEQWFDTLSELGVTRKVLARTLGKAVAA